MKNWNPGKFSVWLIGLALIYSTNIKAQKTFTVQECIDYAFEHNPLLQISSQDIAIAGIGTQRVRGTYMPTLNFSSAFQYYLSNRKVLVEGGSSLAPPSLPEGEPLAINTGYNNSWYPSFNVNQIIFNPAYRSSYNIALQNQQYQEQNDVSFKIEVITGIAKAFNTCKLLEVQDRFLRENIARIDTLIGLIQIKYDMGAGVIFEVNMVNVTGNTLKSELANVENSYGEALVALQFQMNYLEKDSMILSGNFIIPELIDESKLMMLQLQQSDPSVRIENQLLQTQINIAYESIKTEKARSIPVIGFDASLGSTPAADNITNMFQGQRWKPYSYIGVNVGIPIFNGLDVKRSVEQKKIQESQTRYYMDQFRDQFESEKNLSFLRLKNSLERFKYADINLNLATNNVELINLAFINGYADSKDLILGENDLYENQARYYAELQQLILFKIEGQKVIGAFNTQAGMK